MTLVKGTLGTGDTEIFSACDPVITKPAIYRRSCAFGPVKKLWIGYGDFETTKKATIRRS